MLGQEGVAERKKKASLGPGVYQYPSAEKGVLQVVLTPNSTIQCTVGSILWSSEKIDFDLIEAQWCYLYGNRYIIHNFDILYVNTIPSNPYDI